MDPLKKTKKSRSINKPNKIREVHTRVPFASTLSLDAAPSAAAAFAAAVASARNGTIAISGDKTCAITTSTCDRDNAANAPAAAARTKASPSEVPMRSSVPAIAATLAAENDTEEEALSTLVLLTLCDKCQISQEWTQRIGGEITILTCLHEYRILVASTRPEH